MRRLPSPLLLLSAVWSVVSSYTLPTMYMCYCVWLTLAASGGISNAVDDGLWLQQLYKSTHGDWWTDTDPEGSRYGSCAGWNLTFGSTPCQGDTSLWNKRVLCNKNGRVVRLVLGNCNLTGSLPELNRTSSAMSELSDVDWFSNRLTGTLPSSYSQLVCLQTIDLYLNNLTGSLPMSWSRLSRLRSIDVRANQLTGSLPDSWSSLAQLESIALDYNQFMGSIPSSWSSLWFIVNVTFTGNFISGELPSTWYESMRHNNLSIFDVNLNCINLTSAMSNPAQWAWWLSKTSFGAGLLLQRTSCYCGPGQLSTLLGYWCEDCPAGHYCPNASTSIACPVGTYNPSTGKSTAADGCLACPAGWSTAATGLNSSRSCNVSVMENATAQPQLPSPSPSPTNTLSTASAAASMAVSATALVVGADLTVLDLTTFAAVQSVRCSDILRRSSGSASLSSTSPLKYLLSPFSDLGPAVAALGNVGLVAGVAAVHAAALLVVLLRASPSGSGSSSSASRRWTRAMSQVLFPAVSLTVASVLLPGSVRAAILGVTTHTAATLPVGIAAVAATAAALLAVCWVWVRAVQRWCNPAMMAYRPDPMPWVAVAKATMHAVPPLLLVVVHRAVLPRGTWSSSATQRRIGVVFASVAGLRHRWLPGGLLLLSVVTVGVSAAPAELDDPAGCTALHAVLAVLACLPAAAVLIRRGPYRIGVANGVAVLNSVLTSLTALITAIALQHLSHADGAVRVMDALAVVVYVLSGVRSVVLMGLRVAARVFEPPPSATAGSQSASAVVDDCEAPRGARGSQRKSPNSIALAQLVTMACDMTANRNHA